MQKALLISCLCAAPAFALAPAETKMPAPHESMATRFDALRRNNLRALLHASISPAEMDVLRKEWDKNRRQPVDAAEAAQFEMVMGMLTGPNAEEELMVMLTPKLEELRPQMSMMIGMFSGMVGGAIEQDQSLSTTEKQQASKMVAAIGQFLSENDITDERSARRAVSVVCTTARRLKLNSMKDLQSLSFDQALAKGDVLLKGTKDLFNVYGISFDEWIDSLEFETLSQSGNSATVKVSYEIFGMRDSFEHELAREGRRWVDAE